MLVFLALIGKINVRATVRRELVKSKSVKQWNRYEGLQGGVFVL
jgi:hypothetical protein